MKIDNFKRIFLVFILLVFAGFSLVAIGEEKAQSGLSVFLDSDQDGLSDEEEKMYGTDPHSSDTDGDSYSDGNEIKSGYDPLKKAPGDKINSEKSEMKAQDLGSENEEINFTEEVSAEVSNLIYSKASVNEDISMEDLDELVSEITSKTVTFNDLPEVSEDEIRIKKQDYSKLSAEDKDKKKKEDSIAYLTAIAYVLVNNSPEKIEKVSDLEQISENYLLKASFIGSDFSKVSDFDDEVENGLAALDQIKEIEVPEDFIEIHKQGIQLAKYALDVKNDVKAASEIEDDPILQMAHVGKMQSLVGLTADYITEVSTKVSALGIDTLPISF